MDSINVEKIQALRKYKEKQFVSNMLFYPLAILAFFVFCTSPFWFPSFYGSSKTLMCVSIPRFVSLFFNVKSLFLLGNLIVIFLLRESKLRPSNNRDDLLKPILSKMGSKKAKVLNKTDNNKCPEKSTLVDRGSEEVKMHTASPGVSRIVFSDPQSAGKISKVGYIEDDDEKGEERRQNEGKELIVSGALSTDELKQRADDFIAMVNMQIRLEAEDVLLDAF